MGRLLPLALVLAGLAAPAAAQLRYTESAGRYTEFSSPELPRIILAASNRSAVELVDLFQKLCIAPMLDAERTDAAVKAAGWQALRQDAKVPFKPAEYDEPVRQWAGEGMVLSLVRQTIGPPTGNRFRIPGPQCNLIAGFGAQPKTDLDAAMTGMVGSDPANIEEMTKNGKPNKRYTPRWLIATPGTGAINIGINAFPPSDYNPQGVLMLSVLPPLPAKKP